MKAIRVCKMMLATVALVATSTALAHDGAAKGKAFHEALEACFTETGVAKPSAGKPPTPADKQKVDACLAQKGVMPPKHPMHHEMPPPAGTTPPAAATPPPAPAQ